jgi:hypothetical protein
VPEHRDPVGVWPVSAEARERLTAAFDRAGVFTAVLYKPRAPLEGGKREELEIAVWLDPERRFLRRARQRLDLRDAAEAVLGTDLVDVLVLNHTSELLRARVAAEGIPILDRRAIEMSRRRRIERRVEHVLDIFARAPRAPRLDDYAPADSKSF